MMRILRAAALATLALAAGAASSATPASAAAAPAADGVRLIHERLRISPVLKGEFEQVKTL